MALSVIGAGFGRTGTLSLKLALEDLGFGPCCHGSDEHHFGQGAQFWERIFRREPIEWDQLFADYRSAVDSPTCKHYLELARHYPSAKVVLTERESDAWFDSYQDTILPMTASVQGKKHFSFLFGHIAPDRDSMISVYEQHNAEVKELIPRDRLLVYDVKQGWPPLCEFLGVPVPDRPFPRSNSRAQFAATIDGMLARL